MTESKWIEVDGSTGKGGEQMLRSSLALSMATGSGGGKFKTQPLTLHLTTHLAIIEKSLEVESTIEAQENRSQLVTLV